MSKFIVRFIEKVNDEITDPFYEFDSDTDLLMWLAINRSRVDKFEIFKLTDVDSDTIDRFRAKITSASEDIMGEMTEDDNELFERLENE